mmetsp:Transcript_30135/g.71786  ORF Transcript_30135/g.71786 Transcript_30135/m.71786 type:complete len:201 (+) Transcript_30135:489-1091(+)
MLVEGCRPCGDRQAELQATELHQRLRFEFPGTLRPHCVLLLQLLRWRLGFGEAVPEALAAAEVQLRRIHVRLLRRLRFFGTGCPLPGQLRALRTIWRGSGPYHLESSVPNTLGVSDVDSHRCDHDWNHGLSNLRDRVRPHVRRHRARLGDAEGRRGRSRLRVGGAASEAGVDNAVHCAGGMHPTFEDGRVPADRLDDTRS